jgi:hypothetical protein
VARDNPRCPAATSAARSHCRPACALAISRKAERPAPARS